MLTLSGAVEFNKVLKEVSSGLTPGVVMAKASLDTECPNRCELNGPNRHLIVRFPPPLTLKAALLSRTLAMAYLREATNSGVHAEAALRAYTLRFCRVLQFQLNVVKMQCKLQT